jgi:hypothetical protein
MGKGNRKEQIVCIVVFLIIFFFLLNYFDPSLILADKTTSGGDTGSHYFPAVYMRYYLLPNFKMVGWCPYWFAGMPIFHFYFPLPYIIMSFISIFTGIQIGFRIGTLIGVFLLPVTTYFSFKFMRLKFPTPIMAAVLTLPFLFLETHSMYGGNILSTLAGEFAHSLSLSLAVLFFGLVYRGIEDRRYIVWSAILLSLTMLSSIFPGMICVLGSGFFLLSKNWRKNLIYLAKVFSLAFVLIGFWTIPFLLKLDYTTSYNWLQFQKLGDMFPLPLLPYSFIALAGIILYRKNRAVRYFLFSIVLSFLFYFLLPQGHLWNNRFLPIVYLFTLFVCAVAIPNFLNKLKAKWLLPFILLFIILISVQYTSHKVKPWVEWNYEGYEGKSDRQFLELNDYLKELPQDRIMYEYSESHNKYGSPRAFESIPAYSGKPTITGLLIDGAVTAIFHFTMQPELSEKPSCPIMGQHCPSVNLDKGLAHMKMFNIKYFIATSDTVKQLAHNHTDYQFLKSIGDLDIFSIDSTGYVDVLDYEPVFVSRKNWKQRSLKWFEGGDLDVPMIFEKQEPAELSKIKLNTSHCVVSNEKISNEELEFDTNCIGEPHLIKISYFPNWKVEGAEKVYLASPSFMIVYPSSNHVRLYYGIPWMDLLGYLATFAGILAVILAIFKIKPFRKLEDMFLNIKLPKIQFYHICIILLVLFFVLFGNDFSLGSTPVFSNWRYSADNGGWINLSAPYGKPNIESAVYIFDLDADNMPIKKLFLSADDCMEKFVVNNMTVFDEKHCGVCTHCAGFVIDINEYVRLGKNEVIVYLANSGGGYSSFNINILTTNPWLLFFAGLLILLFVISIYIRFYPNYVISFFISLKKNILKYTKKILKKISEKLK